MKNILKHIAGSIAGSLVLLLLLRFEDLLDFLGITERSEFMYPPQLSIFDLIVVVVFFIVILILQLSLVNPIIHYLKKWNRCTGWNLTILAALLSLTFGAFFGLIIGAEEFGFEDILISSAIAMGVSFLQYSVNFLTFFGIEHLTKGA